MVTVVEVVMCGEKVHWREDTHEQKGCRSVVSRGGKVDSRKDEK